MTLLVYGFGCVINQQVCNDRFALNLPVCETVCMCVYVCVPASVLMKGSKTRRVIMQLQFSLFF